MLSIVGFILGFACPYWAMLKLEPFGYMDQTIGLWQACIHGSLACASNIHFNNPPWINAARALSSICLIMLSMVIFMGCYRNVSKHGQANCNMSGRQVEVLAVLAVLVGSIGAIIFAAEFHRIYMFDYNVGHLHWAFGVVCASLGMAGVCALVMFGFHSPKPSRPGAVVRSQGPNCLSVSIQIPIDQEEDWRLHIPYFGEVSPNQIVHGAGPVLPPSYEMVTSGLGYVVPPQDGSGAPPLYEDITKDAGPHTFSEVANLEAKDGEDKNLTGGDQE